MWLAEAGVRGFAAVVEDYVSEQQQQQQLWKQGEAFLASGQV